jgi:hypothetical protein
VYPPNKVTLVNLELGVARVTTTWNGAVYLELMLPSKIIDGCTVNKLPAFEEPAKSIKLHITNAQACRLAEAIRQPPP